MLNYLLKRCSWMVLTVILVSIISFIVIQLPPGDFLTTYIATLTASGQSVDESEVAALKARYGLDRPIYVQYYIWISGIVTRGDFGQSFQWNRPVKELIWERVWFTVILSGASLVFSWVVAIPIGIYSAVNKYSIMDYIVTFLGFIGLSTPNFMFALVLMWVLYSYFGISPGGLFSEQFIDAPWSWARMADMAQHLVVPVIVTGTAGTAGLIRTLRARLLDELNRPYVTTARAKGLPPWELLIKYPVRLAILPFISTIGWVLPQLISGGIIVAIVLNLPTVGPMLHRALTSQDMYLAGSIILITSVLTVIGTLISDLLLAWLDPRIRYE
ncbi:MAG: ABC transporter permease [Firmicutes bacterium]|nr:ABC transporter permease [Bacillota bacterium]